MGRVDSPLRDRMIFNVGARRSGTYWLQRIVTAHPDVAAVPTETHLFYGVSLLHQLLPHGNPDRDAPAQTHVDRDVLLDATRDFCDRVFLEFAEPGVEFVSERTPLHVRHLGLMGSVYPDARFVHIVRDGRDVARSLVSMDWGPDSIAPAAREWAESVLAARRAPRPNHYTEIRYEHLLADPGGEIPRLYKALGLAITPEALERGLAEASLHRNRDGSGSPPAVGKWQSAFSSADLAVFHRVAGAALIELGYDGASKEPGALPEGIPASGPTPDGNGRRARLGPLRGRGRAAADLRRQVQRQAVRADELLSALTVGGVEQVGQLCARDLSWTVIDPDRERSGHGAGMRGELLYALAEDPGFRSRLLHRRVHPGVPIITLVLEYELPDGARVGRTIVATVEGDRVTKLDVHRYPLVARPSASH